MRFPPLRIVSHCLAVVCVATFAASCAQPPPPRDPGALALVVGGRSNMPQPRLSPRAQDIVRESVLSKDELYVIGVSGTPRLLHSERINQHCDSQRACRSTVQRWTAKVQSLVSAVKADTEEANTLEAIAHGARAMAGVAGHKQIIVLDSGLQTTGELPLQIPGALANAQEIATLLHDKKRLEPALQGVNVTFMGLGQVAAPQPDLPQRMRGQLGDLWKAVLSAADADVDIDEGALVGVPPDPALPPVTVVKVEDEPVFATCTPIRADQVGFLADQAEFRDRSEALRVLKPIADKLIAENLQAELVGTTALPETDSGPGSLSSRRAAAVRGVLVDLGVPETALTTSGVGTNFAAYPKPPAPPPAPAELAQYRLVYVQIAGSRC